MRQLMLLVLCGLAGQSALYAQTTYVVLKVQAVNIVTDPTVQVLTLATGEKVTVKTANIDHAVTAKLNEVLGPQTTTAPIRAADSGTVRSGLIRQKCEKEWPTDFSMRAYCEKQQHEAVSKLQGRSMVTGDQRIIRSQCAKEWPDDYQMQNYCEEQQLKALQQLGR